MTQLLKVSISSKMKWGTETVHCHVKRGGTFWGALRGVQDDDMLSMHLESHVGSVPGPPDPPAPIWFQWQSTLRTCSPGDKSNETCRLVIGGGWMFSFLSLLAFSLVYLVGLVSQPSDVRSSRSSVTINEWPFHAKFQPEDIPTKQTQYTFRITPSARWRGVRLVFADVADPWVLFDFLFPKTWNIRFYLNFFLYFIFSFLFICNTATVGRGRFSEEPQQTVVATSWFLHMFLRGQREPLLHKPPSLLCVALVGQVILMVLAFVVQTGGLSVNASCPLCELRCFKSLQRVFF